MHSLPWIKMQALNKYQERLIEKCSSDPAPVISPPHLVPVLDYFIDTMIKKTPKALTGNLPDGSPELLVKARKILGSMPDEDLCEESGTEKVKEAMMPHVTDNLLPMKLSFDRHCPVYRDWLNTEEGKSFITGLNVIVDKILV